MGGMSRPSVFAVLRLIARVNVVGSWTGRSAGFSPFTGVSVFNNLLGSKRLGLLHRMVPTASPIAILANPNQVRGSPQCGISIEPVTAWGQERP
jgi:hypothetical protein